MHENRGAACEVLVARPSSPRWPWTPNRTTLSTWPPKPIFNSTRPQNRVPKSTLPTNRIPNTTWPPAHPPRSTRPPEPPPGPRQLVEVNKLAMPHAPSCPMPRIPQQHRSGAEGKRRVPAVPGEGAHGQMAVRELLLLQRGYSEKAKEETWGLQRKVQYLKGQYEERERDVEELLAAVRSEWGEAERERQEIEQQNAELRSFNTELRSLIFRLQTCADPPHLRRAPKRVEFPFRPMATDTHPCTRCLLD
ncbi:hypothetical protein AAFF_G00065660 [Aldrovandia affinis]|uniref:Uncharacterized protein n=1 Tax=Aldrovandia affinis TaxID=143900 RepID=A0AAD7WYU9_9TELE|nr:hypothetical protein AAFF_G00065660 [Aldrovandia affinis]